MLILCLFNISVYFDESEQFAECCEALQLAEHLGFKYLTSITQYEILKGVIDKGKQKFEQFLEESADLAQMADSVLGAQVRQLLKRDEDAEESPQKFNQAVIFNNVLYSKFRCDEMNKCGLFRVKKHENIDLTKLIDKDVKYWHNYVTSSKFYAKRLEYLEQEKLKNQTAYTQPTLPCAEDQAQQPLQAPDQRLRTAQGNAQVRPHPPVCQLPLPSSPPPASARAANALCRRLRLQLRLHCTALRLPASAFLCERPLDPGIRPSQIAIVLAR